MTATTPDSAATRTTDVAGSPRPLGLRLSEVQPHRVEWLWPGRLPFAKLGVLEGDPMQGKSTVTNDLAARVTTGSPMPGEFMDRDPRGVLLLSAEDDLASTIRPRLDAAGADLDRIVTITGIPDEGGERPLSLPRDLQRVEDVIVEHEVALVVLDPLTAFLDASVDAMRDQAVRRVMHALASLAERTGATILAIRHLTKATGARAMYRGGGSIGIIAAARVGLLVAPDPIDPSRRVLRVIKSNLGMIPPTLAYRLVPHDTGVATVVWEGEVESVAIYPVIRDSAPKLTSAEGLLRELLAEGPRLRREIEAAARERGIGWRTVETAKATLGVTDRQVPVPGRRGAGPSYWALPGRSDEEMSMDRPECDPTGPQR